MGPQSDHILCLQTERLLFCLVNVEAVKFQVALLAAHPPDDFKAIPISLSVAAAMIFQPAFAFEFVVFNGGCRRGSGVSKREKAYSNAI
jgi:hypothetical protein